jgi:hypothetical protein
VYPRSRSRTIGLALAKGRSIVARLAATALVLLISVVALAAPRDNAANKKIDEAINQHYLATDFDKAEGILTGTIKACEDKCSPSVLGRAWMYVGIVRGSGKGDQKGAIEAFKQALATDPNVKLDEALATPETKKAFGEAGGAGGAPEPPEAPPKKGGTPPPSGGGEDEDVVGDMECTPEVREIQTRRKVPVSCASDEEATKIELFYKVFGEDKWETLRMKKKGDFFQAEIPCTATKDAGKLKMYVRAKDAGGDTVDSWGSKRKPVEFDVVSKTEAEPPSFPDKDPPDRCPEQEICPPDLPGCGSGGGGGRGDVGWGGTCESTSQCQSGLFCQNGACENAPSCDVDADCTQGKCVSGTCDVGGGDGPAGPYKKNWFGIHVAHDIAIVGGDDVCSRQSQADEGFACFQSGSDQQYGRPLTLEDPQPGVANKIATGFSPPGSSTTRFLLSYERAFTPNITVGLRAGYAIGGGPAPEGGAAFLPVHGEVRGAYYFGKNALARKGFRPYVHVGGGMAQVDAKLEVTVRDCAGMRPAGTQVAPVQATPEEYQACVGGQQIPNNREAAPLTLDAYKKLGQGFGTAGGGIIYALTEKSGIQLNINIMIMLPSSGTVIEPSLGYVMGL